MILVPRDRVAAPLLLTSEKAQLARQEASAFFRGLRERRKQTTFSFRAEIFRDPLVIERVAELFYGKCAYCETPLDDNMPADIDHFRPMSAAIGRDGSLVPDGYWWLAYEWSNLYAICAECGSMKGYRFPVERDRATPETYGDDLRAEGSLLFDPCLDDPESELVFMDDGTVASSTERGLVTIETLGLNRQFLISARAQERSVFEEEWSALNRRLQQGDWQAALEADSLSDAARPYAAMRRQLLGRVAQDLGAQLQALVGVVATEGPSLEEVASALEPLLRGASESAQAVSPSRMKTARASLRTFQENLQSSSADETSAGSDFFLAARMIQRVEIRNFRVIRDLALEFPVRQERGAPWLMLVGENGTGKSSVLQAVTLALMGDQYRSVLPIDPAKLVRHRARSGHVKVFLTGLSQPCELTITKDPPGFEASPAEPSVLLLGYGATRLLPRGQPSPPAPFAFARVDNLFNPFVPLMDATHWLLSLSEEQFDTAAIGIKKLLPMDPDDALERDTHHGRVQARVFGNRLSLDELSDGYQSVVALATDVMQVMLSRWGDMEVAEGIVAIDELESHLHPRWKMLVVSALRGVFPRVQFIATTHDPLCLRGLRAGEVVVLKRTPDDQIFAEADLPTVQGLRVDQLLMSEHFGLSSTVDPDTELLFAEYYDLLARRSPTPDQSNRLSELRSVMAQLDLMGTTIRERLMLETIDRYLATVRSVTDPTDRDQMRRRMEADAMALYATISPEPISP